jgi:hypothetical protein
MGLVANDIVAVTYESLYCDQQIRYCLHYKVTAPGNSTNPESDLDAIAHHFGSTVLCPLTGHIFAVSTPEIGTTGVTAQRVYPQRTIMMRYSVSIPGSHAGQGMPPNTAAVVTKRTLTPGRMGRGSLHLTAIPFDMNDRGVIAPGNRVEFNPILDDLVKAQVVSAIQCTLEPGLFNPTHPPTFWSRLFDCDLMDTLRVMRRRTVRVGV